MIKEIIVLNRMSAELLCYGIGKTPKNKWLLISICSPEEEMIRCDYIKNQLKKWGCSDWISLLFDDITKENYKKIKPKFPNISLFSKKNAKTIMEFLEKHKVSEEKLSLFVHCAAGVSRSGAVGWFACKLLGLDKTEFLQQNKNLYPNKYILQVLESLATMDFTTEEEYKNNFALDI